MQIVLISGLSGSGKSIALNVLEDAAYYVVDNLPAVLLPQLVAHLHGAGWRRVAVAVDMRSGASIAALPQQVEALRATVRDLRFIFLEARDDALIARFSETRRRHPMAVDGYTLEEAIQRERDALASVAELGHRIESIMSIHRDPHRMPSFIDNHDVDRFLAGGSEEALRQALLAMLTLPGIPVIWQDTEQGFTAQRRAMFAGGFDSGGRDHFDVDAPLYRYLQRAIALRRGHRLFSRGTPTVLASNAAAAGAIAWRMQHEGEAALVVFNTAEVPVLLDNLAPGVTAGARLEGLFAIEDAPGAVVADAAGANHSNFAHVLFLHPFRLFHAGKLDFPRKQRAETASLRPFR